VSDTFEIIEFLDNLAERCVELLDADAAGLMLADQRNRLNLMAATVQRARELRLFELQVQEGPSLDCFTSGQATTNLSLAESRERWPRFGPAAIESGFGATHALPLRLRGQDIGALSLFTQDRRQLSVTDLAIGQAMADLATIGLLHQRNVYEQTILSEQLTIALNSRVVVEQAKGALADRAHISHSEAFRRMRDYARRNKVTLASVTSEVAAGAMPQELLY
jgi:hypothetical protein